MYGNPDRRTTIKPGFARTDGNAQDV
jgi:hypothetical protein